PETEKRVSRQHTGARFFVSGALPARRLRLWDRGLIREGMSADLVLFDPATINNQNSYMEPTIPPIGIQTVWVLGEVKVSNAR
ncbi:MAG: hypothetical protein RR197_00005, partial [Oscillospiraceae bacterium]